ncbi:hypothetical protein BKA93DRAFT_748411 [Sparassis latifolia]
MSSEAVRRNAARAPYAGGVPKGRAGGTAGRIVHAAREMACWKLCQFVPLGGRDQPPGAEEEETRHVRLIRTIASSFLITQVRSSKYAKRHRKNTGDDESCNVMYWGLGNEVHGECCEEAGLNHWDGVVLNEIAEQVDLHRYGIVTVVGKQILLELRPGLINQARFAKTVNRPIMMSMVFGTRMLISVARRSIPCMLTDLWNTRNTGKWHAVVLHYDRRTGNGILAECVYTTSRDHRYCLYRSERGRDISFDDQIGNSPIADGMGSDDIGNSPTGLFRRTIYYPFPSIGVVIHFTNWIYSIKGHSPDLDASAVIHMSEAGQRSLRIAVGVRQRAMKYRGVEVHELWHRSDVNLTTGERERGQCEDEERKLDKVEVLRGLLYDVADFESESRYNCSLSMVLTRATKSRT